MPSSLRVPPRAAPTRCSGGIVGTRLTVTCVFHYTSPVYGPEKKGRLISGGFGVAIGDVVVGGFFVAGRSCTAFSTLSRPSCSLRKIEGQGTDWSRLRRGCLVSSCVFFYSFRLHRPLRHPRRLCYHPRPWPPSPLSAPHLVLW